MSNPSSPAAAGALDRSQVVSAVTAMVAGALLLLAVGFAGPAVLHNAAHDTRHSLAFPCH